MKRLSLFAFSMAVASNSFAYSDYSYPRLETPWWFTFMGFLMIAWGILEIILFFKIWGMTNDIRKLVKHFCGQTKPSKPDADAKPFHIPENPNDIELEEYDHRLDDVKVGDKVRRTSDGKILEVISVEEKALECRGGMLDGIHTYPKDALTFVSQNINKQ